MCECFGNMCTCIVCTVFFCIVSFMYIYSYLFCLYQCKDYSHRVSTQLQLIIIIIIIISVVNEHLNVQTTLLLISQENAAGNSFPWTCVLVGIYITV